MTQEAYVSFEIAKLLKEKGFNWECRTCYEHGELKTEVCRQYADWNGRHEVWELMSAPTHQMAMAWLRELHDIIIVIEPHAYDYINEKNSSYVTSLWQGDNYYENVTLKNYPTYEEAVDATLKYALENLL